MKSTKTQTDDIAHGVIREFSMLWLIYVVGNQANASGQVVAEAD